MRFLPALLGFILLPCAAFADLNTAFSRCVSPMLQSQEPDLSELQELAAQPEEDSTGYINRSYVFQQDASLGLVVGWNIDREISYCLFNGVYSGDDQDLIEAFEAAAEIADLSVRHACITRFDHEIAIPAFPKHDAGEDSVIMVRLLIYPDQDYTLSAMNIPRGVFEIMDCE